MVTDISAAKKKHQEESQNLNKTKNNTLNKLESIHKKDKD